MMADNVASGLEWFTEANKGNEERPALPAHPEQVGPDGVSH